MIIISLKGAIRDFLQSPHCAVNCLQHIHSSGPGAIVPSEFVIFFFLYKTVVIQDCDFFLMISFKELSSGYIFNTNLLFHKVSLL